MQCLNKLTTSDDLRLKDYLARVGSFGAQAQLKILDL